MSFLFNGIDRTITLTSSEVELDALDIYSAWKEWSCDAGIAYPIAFQHEYTDELLPPSVEVVIFLVNDWQIASKYTPVLTGSIIRRPSDNDLPVFKLTS